MKDNADASIIKALERLVTSLISEADPDLSRLDMVEEAISYAALILGMSPPDHKALREQLDTVAVQLITDKVERENIKIYQVAVTCEHDHHVASVFATTDDFLASELSRSVDKIVDNKSKKTAQDFSIN
jgi:tRNA A22 N-methylase